MTEAAITKKQGDKFDSGKNRLDLLPVNAINQVGKVLTFGCGKYGDRNWENGIKWSKIIGSLKRHLAAIEGGIDYDEESGLLHASHAATNALMLLEYYKSYPEGDDRPIYKYKKIGLDIDDVLSDFVAYYCKTFGMQSPEFWHFDRQMDTRLKELPEDWWLNMPIKTLPSELPFEPHCYITARSVDSSITQKWLDLNGFPQVPLYSVGFGTSKVEAAKSSGIDIFVDDNYKNFMQLNEAGICTYLFTTQHNLRYDVGYKRLNDFKELIKKQKV